MDRWTISRGLDGFKVELRKTPAWRVAVARSSEWLAVVLLRHRLCCALPEWAWSVPTGPPRRDDDGLLENSVGGWLWLKTTALFCLDLHESVASVPIDRDLGLKLWPEAEGSDWLEDDSDTTT